MGQRGPRPKPLKLKVLGGNPGKRPLATDRVAGGRVRRGIPARPPELTGVAAEEWDRVAAELDAAGSLSVLDAPTLAVYCLAYADALAARVEIAKSGRWLSTPVQTARGETLGEKVIEHPAVKTLRQASKDVRALANDLGLTPAARSRLEGGPVEAERPENKVLAIRERIQAARNGG